MPTEFEHLPNELFLGVFIYFDISNLYHTFWGLNKRFNNLLRSLNNFPLIIGQNNSLLSHIFPDQISRLRVNTSQSIDLSQFSNLNSLELCQASRDQVEQIRSNIMPNLSSLKISSPFHISLPSSLIQEIFSNNFPVLREAHLSRLGSFEKFQTFQSLSLHMLFITCSDLNIIPAILQACPNLLSFHVTFFGQNRYISPTSTLPYDSLLEEFFLDDPYHQLTFDTIDTLFRYIPNVKYLSLLFLCRVPFMQLVESILNQLEQLHRFECYIIEMRNYNMADVEVIQQMNECFRYLQCDDKNDGSRVFFTE